jgi:hypothetical protein
MKVKSNKQYFSEMNEQYRKGSDDGYKLAVENIIKILQLKNKIYLKPAKFKDGNILNCAFFGGLSNK